MATLVFDGKCGFCAIWIDYWKQLTGDAIEYAPFQEVASRYPQIALEAFRKAVQLILPSGEVMSGAHAVFWTLAVNPSRTWPLWLYRHLPGFAAVTELGYRIIAAHRDLFYWVTVVLFGRKIRPLRYERVQSLFVRTLGVIWISAFISFGLQSAGLIGPHGVLPANFADATIHGVCIAGALCGLLAVLGVFWRGALLLAFLLYLFLVNVSQEFLSYQWDILLLETGLLSVFLGYSRVIIWLFRLLLFRLMFLSGAVKLLSGDPTWRGLTALTVHYQTQPLPTPLAWYAHQLPLWFQKASCFAVLFIELAIPLLVLGPRRVRMFALPWLIGLQILIMLTGNYAYFNWLALALCLFLLDDSRLPRAIPSMQPVLRRTIAWVAAAIIFSLSSLHFIQTVAGRLPERLGALLAFTAPLGITSSYGLFASMTTIRPEIVIEGSNDGATWSAYEFPYKLGRLDRAPSWVAPHQPRLDWQMWFAALGTYRENFWFVNLLIRLLQGTPEVTALLKTNPFPGQPPKLIRAQIYEYRFTDRGERKRTGDWWSRRLLGIYFPPVSLSDFK